jgi:phosphohistidine phosphatase
VGYAKHEPKGKLYQHRFTLNSEDSMARNLFLIRHAAAEPFSNSDLERPLSMIGRQEADLILKQLADLKISFDWVWHSPATRTTQTSHALRDLHKGEPDAIRPAEILYKASQPERILHLISQTPPTVKNLALVGHNPTLSNLAYELSAQQVHYLGNCSVACFSFTGTDWSHAAQPLFRFSWLEEPVFDA